MINKKSITKFLYCLIFLFTSLIFIKLSDNNKEKYYNLFFDSNLSFTSFNTLFTNNFGNILPKKHEAAVSVMRENIYTDYEDYFDGQKFYVSDNTPIYTVIGGLVVYIGEKEEYGKTVIIQGVDGNDYWYGNITNSGVKLYEYVNKNAIIGESANDYFYLVIKSKSGYIKYDTN